jgi:hypothetical protein
MAIEKLTVEILKTSDTGENKVFVDFEVTMNNESRKFTKIISNVNYMTGLSVELLKDEKVVQFLHHTK